MKKLVLLVFMAAMALFPMGCGLKSDGNSIRVAVFLNDPTLLDITNKVIAGIEKQNPGLKIQLEVIPYGEYQDKISTQFAAGSAPDVVYVEVNDFVDLYLRGVFEDLLPYIQKDNLNLKDYYPGVLGRFSRDGHVFAIPQDTAPTGLIYYNKKIFKEAGVPYPTSDWSWPEPFLSICKRLVKRDAKGKVVRWAYNEAYPIQIDNFMLSNGGNWVDNTDHPTKFTMDDPKVIAAARFRVDLMNKYHYAPSVTEIQEFEFSSSSGAENMFVNGKIAMMSSGIWHTPKFLQTKDLDFDVVPFPAGPSGLKGWGTGGSGYAMSKTCKNKDLAWKVIQELTSAQTLSMLAATGMIQPALMSLANSDVFLKAPGAEHKKVLLDMPEHSFYQPFMADWNEVISGTLAPAMDPVWIGTKTPEEVLPDITAKINAKFFSGKPQ